MKIYTIVIYPSSLKDKPFSASLNTGLLQMDPHEKTIRDNKWMADWVKNRQGIHELKPTNSNYPSGIYYGFISQEKISILATDERLTPYAQDVLFKKINEAQNSKDLMQLIQNPTEAIKSDLEKMQEIDKIKIAKIKEDLEDIRQVMLQNMDKLIERGDKIEDLQSKTELLVKDAERFKKESTKLKNRYYCPGLFSIFTSIKNLVWKDSYEYEYRPTPKPK